MFIFFPGGQNVKYNPLGEVGHAGGHRGQEEVRYEGGHYGQGEPIPPLSSMILPGLTLSDARVK